MLRPPRQRNIAGGTEKPASQSRRVVFSVPQRFAANHSVPRGQTFVLVVLFAVERSFSCNSPNKHSNHDLSSRNLTKCVYKSNIYIYTYIIYTYISNITCTIIISISKNWYPPNYIEWENPTPGVSTKSPE